MATQANQDGEQVPPGYRGNLDASQEKALKDIWRRFFTLYESNVEKSAELEKEGGPQNDGFKALAESNDEDPKKKAKKKAGDEDAKKAEETKEMNEFLAEYGGPYLRKAFFEFTKLDHPDVSMLRFLRARKWDIDRSLAMLAAALKFRLDKNIENVLLQGEEGLKDVPGFLNQFRRGISYIKGNTSEPGEYPIYFIHVGRHFTSAQKPEVLQQFVLLAMENARLLCSPPFEKAIIVFDMTGFGLKNMDWQCVLFLVQCLEAYYPESLQRIYIHSSPWIFKGIWAILSPMLDPVVRDKIKFSSKAADVTDHIPAEKLRKGMGGNLDWDWNYNEPVEGENKLLADTATRDEILKEQKALIAQFEEATQKWAETADAEDQVAKDLAFRREVLAKQLRLKQFQLNPYIRAVNVYQRDGDLKSDGSWVWKFPQKDGKVTEQVVGDRHNIPALQKWLRDHNEDDLSNSAGAKASSPANAQAHGAEPPKEAPTEAAPPQEPVVSVAA